MVTLNEECGIEGLKLMESDPFLERVLGHYRANTLRELLPLRQPRCMSGWGIESCGAEATVKVDEDRYLCDVHAFGEGWGRLDIYNRHRWNFLDDDRSQFQDSYELTTPHCPCPETECEIILPSHDYTHLALHLTRDHDLTVEDAIRVIEREEDTLIGY